MFKKFKQLSSKGKKYPNREKVKEKFEEWGDCGWIYEKMLKISDHHRNASEN